MSAIKDARVTITLDRERHMLCSLNVLDEMQDKFGGFDKLSEVIRGKDSMKNIKFLLTLMLNEGADDGEDPVTEKWVGKKIHIGNMQEVTDKLYEAFNVAVTGSAAPSASDEVDADPNPQGGTV